jgi:endonuclease/exonuclease/phosphatase (EEP) superfamily protein YafD
MSDTAQEQGAVAADDRQASPQGGPARGRWCWYTRVLVIVSAAWTAWTVAQSVLSGHWWFMLAPDLMPPLLFAVVPPLLLLGVPAVRVARRRLPRRATWTVAVLTAVSLGLGLPWSGLNVHALTGRAAVPPGALRIMSWNTDGWGKRTTADRFYAYLKARHADIYLLQESDWSDANDEYDRPLADPARIYREFPGYHIALRGELITISRFPIVAQPPIGPDREVAARPDADWQAVYRAAKVLRTDLRVGDRVLSTYNVHIRVPVDVRKSAFGRVFYRVLHDRESDRRTQFAGLVSDLRSNPGPALVAGDFNTSPAMGELAPLRSELTDAASKSTSLYPMSWKELGGLPLWRLDWTFTTSQVRVHRYALAPVPGVSDHRAQFVRASLRS